MTLTERARAAIAAFRAKPTARAQSAEPAPLRGRVMTAMEPLWVPGNASVARNRRVGSAGTAFYWGRIRYEEFNPDLENDKGFGRFAAQGIFDKMRRTDPHVARSLKLLKLPLRSAKWIIEPGMDTDAGKEHAEFVSYCMFERLHWDDTLRQSLLMYDFGFHLFEVLEDEREVPRVRFPNLPARGPRSAGRPAIGETTKAVVWTGFEPRPAKTIYRWTARDDEPTKVAAVMQLLGVDDKNDQVFRVIPGERLLRFTHEQEGANFQGISAIRAAYKPWFVLEQLERLDAIRHERQNVGVPVVTLPEGANDSDISKADEILSHLASNEQGYVTLPPGWKLEWLTSSQHHGTDVRGAIADLKRDIADNVLAGFMAMGGGNAVGSYALADTQADQYLATIEAGASYVERVFNQGTDNESIIKRLIDLNYGPQDYYPRLKATNLKSRDYGQILPLVAQLIQNKALTPDAELENFLRTRLDLPANVLEAEEAIDEIEPEDDAEESAQKTVDAAPGASDSPPIGPATDIAQKQAGGVPAPQQGRSTREPKAVPPAKEPAAP